jgi:hypothetical protein
MSRNKEAVGLAIGAARCERIAAENRRWQSAGKSALGLDSERKSAVACL